MRLKPRLAVTDEPAAEPAVVVAAEPVIAPPPPPAIFLPEPAPQPALVAPAAEGASAGGSRIRLRPRATGDAAAPAVVVPPTSPPPSPPPLFIIDPPSAPPTPAVVVPVVTPPPEPEPSAAAAPGAEPVKFKLKPKVGAPPPHPSSAPAAPQPPPPVAPAAKFPPPPGLAKSALPPPPPPPGAEAPAEAPAEAAPKSPPPFPVVAPPATGKTTPPIPHINVTSEEPVEEAKPPKKLERRRASKMGVAGAGLVGVFVLAFAVYYVWTNFISPPPPPPPPVAAKPKPVAPAPAAVPAPAAATTATPPVTSSIATKPAAPLTPSDTLNALAKAPVNAINKAQDAVAARDASGQSRIDAMNTAIDPAATATKAAVAPAKPPVTANATLAPGVSATATDVDVMTEAVPAFRTFVANAKITGVIAGTPGKIILNGRLARAGDMVEPALGVTFEGIDGDRKLLVFRDKSGAVVTKKY